MTSQPKSIVHQIFRVAKSVSRTCHNITKRKKPRSKMLHPLDSHSGEAPTTVAADSNSQSLHEEYDNDEESPGADNYELVVSEIYSDELEEDKKLEEYEVFSSWQKEGEYRTVTQDDILDKCLGNNAGKVVLYFYNSERHLEQGEYLDKQLTQLASLFRGCKVLRVEGCLAPLVARKLNVKKFPTIVAINNGKLEDCLSDMEGKKQGYVQEWFFKTGFVNFPGFTMFEDKAIRYIWLLLLDVRGSDLRGMNKPSALARLSDVVRAHFLAIVRDLMVRETFFKRDVHQCLKSKFLIRSIAVSSSKQEDEEEVSTSIQAQESPWIHS